MEKVLSFDMVLADNGKLLSYLFKYLKNIVRPGANTMFIEKVIRTYFNKYGCQKALDGEYYSNISLNNVIAHGTPSIKDVIKTGDIVKIDIVLKRNDLHVDSTYTYIAGKPRSEKDEFLVKSAQSITQAGIDAIRIGEPVSLIGNAIYKEAKKRGLKVYYQFSGHGIGKNIHQEPKIPHWNNTYKYIVTKNMAFTVEPIVTFDSFDCKKQDDNSYLGQNNCAQFEHTILIDENGKVKVLTI